MILSGVFLLSQVSTVLVCQTQQLSSSVAKTHRVERYRRRPSDAIDDEHICLQTVTEIPNSASSAPLAPSCQSHLRIDPFFSGWPGLAPRRRPIPGANSPSGLIENGFIGTCLSGSGAFAQGAQGVRLESRPHVRCWRPGRCLRPPLGTGERQKKRRVTVMRCTYLMFQMLL